eukprot:Skav208053  [mRNA]  locus=scaffold1124:145895:148185:- [translate_table: standard]
MFRVAFEHDIRSGGQPVNNLSDMVRIEMAMAGFTECMNWSLLSQKAPGTAGRWLVEPENYTWMRREADPKGAQLTVEKPHEYSATGAQIPKTIGFEIVRTTMIPGILKTLANNKQPGRVGSKPRSGSWYQLLMPMS